MCASAFFSSDNSPRTSQNMYGFGILAKSKQKLIESYYIL